MIFGMSVLLWFLQSFDFTMHFTQNSEESMLGTIGSFIAPIFKPAGFGTWQAAVALLTGLVAKEAVVSSMCLFYGISATAGTEAAAILSGTFGTPVAAYAFLIFTLLYVPCMAAFSTMKKEMGGWKWALGSAAYQIGIAYVLAVIVYQAGKYSAYVLAGLIILWALYCIIKYVINRKNTGCDDCSMCNKANCNECNRSK